MKSKWYEGSVPKWWLVVVLVVALGLLVNGITGMTKPLAQSKPPAKDNLTFSTSISSLPVAQLTFAGDIVLTSDGKFRPRLIVIEKAVDQQVVLCIEKQPAPPALGSWMTPSVVYDPVQSSMYLSDPPKTAGIYTFKAEVDPAAIPPRVCKTIEAWLEGGK